MRSIKYVLAALSLLATPALAQGTFATSTLTGSVSLTGQHTLVGFHTTITTGAFVMAFDAAAVPSSGTLASLPSGCFYVPPPASPALAITLGMANTPSPIVVQTGLVLVLSSTGCNVYTPATGYLAVIYQ